MTMVIFGFILGALGVAGMIHSMVATSPKQVRLNDTLFYGYVGAVCGYGLSVIALVMVALVN